MKEVIHIKVNPEVLKWARETLAYNRAKAAKESGISPKRLEQLEENKKQPSLDELKALAKIYKRTIATLLLEKPPKEKPLPKDRRTINSEDLGKFHEKTIMAVRKARALVQTFIELKKDAGQVIKPFQYKATLNDIATEVASSLRKELQLDEIRQLDNINHTLGAYIEKIESLGVAVFQLSLTQDNLRGFSLVDEQMPVIAIRRGGENATAKIFTLFHELAHILLHEEGICDIAFNVNAQQIEKWCNSFAAEILIPSAVLVTLPIVKKQISSGEKEWAKMDLVELAKFFHVGPLAILRRLLDHNLTTAAFYKAKHEVWNKPTFGRAKHPEGRNIAKETIKEKGRAYISLAFNAFDQNRIDLKDLSDFLGIKLSYIPKTRQLLNAS